MLGGNRAVAEKRGDRIHSPTNWWITPPPQCDWADRVAMAFINPYEGILDYSSYMTKDRVAHHRPPMWQVDREEALL